MREHSSCLVHRRATVLLLVMGLASTLGLGPPASAAVLTVGPGGGYTHGSIRAALAAAQSNDVIRIAAGTYSTNTAEIFPLVADKPLVLESMVATSPPAVTVQGDGAHTVLRIGSPGVTVRGLRITGGLGSEGVYAMDGGGVCVYVGAHDTGDVVLADCLIDGNACPTDETYDGCGGGVYCGGTYCTCFRTVITNCAIRSNRVRGNGAGVYGAIISHVEVYHSEISGNTADDRGGGLCADTYSILSMYDTEVLDNTAAGDPLKADWGGKGGGVYLGGLVEADLTSCLIAGNRAKYFGGGLFTMSGQPSNRLVRCRVAENRADAQGATLQVLQPSGGGAYLREQAFLICTDTVFFRNDALEDGGGALVSGNGSTGGRLILGDGCAFEGNECVANGGGLALGPGGRVAASGTRFLGNTCGLDGGAVHAASGGVARLTNCVVTYNNAARSRGAGLFLEAGAAGELDHVTAVGNFAAWGRSAIVAPIGAVCLVANSILWRNAGGSIEAAAGACTAADSLLEDADLAGPNVVHDSPRFVGWAGLTGIHVDAAAPPGGNGSAGSPFANLQIALDGFSLALGSGSPCLGTATNGTDMGAATGAGGAPGAVVAPLFLAAGLYDIRGRNIMMTRGVAGLLPALPTIQHAVFGHIEDAYFRNLAIAGEAWYGGATLRSNALFDACTVGGNTCLYDGGGVYVAGGICTLSNASVSANTSFGRGGGVWVGDSFGLVADQSTVDDNRSVHHGGGVYLASKATALIRRGSAVRANANDFGGWNPLAEGGGIYALQAGWVTVLDSAISLNASASNGGGMRVGCPTFLANSWIVTNTSTLASGGGVFSSGDLVATNCEFVTNTTLTSGYDAGGLRVDAGSAYLVDCRLRENRASDRGGALYVGAAVTRFVAEACTFASNQAWIGGAARLLDNYTASVLAFSNCLFLANRARTAGGVDLEDTLATFDHSRFFANRATVGDGGAGVVLRGGVLVSACVATGNSAVVNAGAFRLLDSSSSFGSCFFEANVAGTDGGTVKVGGYDQTRFLFCTSLNARAGSRGGGLYAMDVAQPVLYECLFATNASAVDGGAVACRSGVYLRVHSTTFQRCAAPFYGGAIYADGQATCEFARCLFEANAAYTNSKSADGGGIFATDNTRTAVRCTRFLDNHAQDNGGAISIQGAGRLTATNVLAAGNTAVNDGGGLHLVGTANAWLQNCTLASNDAVNVLAGGIYVESTCALDVNSCILYGNAPDQIAGTGVPSVRYSCVQGGYPGTGNIAGNPLLTWPGATLGGGSPAIDAGDPTNTLDDAVRPPGQGTTRNDLGWTGGPANDCPPPAMNAWLVNRLALCAAPGQLTETLVGRISVPPLTDGPGTVPTMEAQVGRGDPALHPSSWTVWADAAYRVQSGAADDYQARLALPATGVCAYAWRFRLQSGPWLYADADGSTNGLQAAQCGELRAGDVVFLSMTGATDLALLSSAAFTSGVLRLTPDVASKLGAAWYRFRVPVGDADGFDSAFTFRINRDGGHGLAFVLQDSSTNALGGDVNSMGYNFARCLAVEFDTWTNTDVGEINDNHISIQTRGTTANNRNHLYSLGIHHAPPWMSDGTTHVARVRYRDGRMQVCLDRLRTPLLDVAVDLTSTLALSEGWLWAGFTAATGSGNAHETHDILDWTFAHGALTFPDADGDGLPDWWERQHFGSDTAANPGADTDGDRALDGEEYAADTDPHDPLSFLRLTAVRRGPDGPTVDWTGGQGVVQYLEASADPALLIWTAIFTNRPPTPVSDSYLDEAIGNGRRIYRIRADATGQ